MKKVRFYYDMIFNVIKEVFSFEENRWGDFHKFNHSALAIGVIVTEVASLICWFIAVFTKGEPIIITLLAIPFAISFYLFVIMSLLAITFNVKDVEENIRKKNSR